MFIKKEDQTGMNLSKLSIILATIGVFALIAGCFVISVTFLAFSAMSAIINFSNLPQANKKYMDFAIIISLMCVALFFAIMTCDILIIISYLTLFLYITIKILVLSETNRKELIDSISGDIKVLFGEMYGQIIMISTAGFIFVFSVLGEYLLAVFMFVMLLTEIFMYLVVAMPEKKQKTLLNIKTILLLLTSLVAVSILALYYIGLLEIALIFLIISSILALYYIGLLEIAMLLIIIISIAYCVYKAYMFRND